MNEMLFLRAAERILVVIIGGIGVYLGYRLFLSIPEQKEGEANLKFPGGVSVYIARVGPGVFFALFGAAIVGLSLHKAIQFSEDILVRQPQQTSDQDASFKRSFLGAGETVRSSDAQARDASRNLLRGEIVVLNTIPLYLREDLPVSERYKLEQAIRRTKVAVMESVWAGDWGDSVGFKRWVQNGAVDPVPHDLKNAAEYFREGSIR
jgi:hypothetical protein